MYAVAENIQPRLSPFPFQCVFHPRDARKQVFVDVGVHLNTAFPEQFAHAFRACQRALVRRRIDERADASLAVRVPAERRADPLDRRRVVIDVPFRLVVFSDHIYIVVEIHAVPMRGERIVEPGIDGDRVLPFEGNGKRLDHVYILIELGIDEPLVHGEFPVAAAQKFVFPHRLRQKRDLALFQKRIVAPLHKLVPDLGIFVPIEINFVV